MIVHTGQHYDPGMSEIFFKELEIPEPKYNLGVGSSTHGRQTGQMMVNLENVMCMEEPELVLVYGDTNSTLAGALVAAKRGIPVAHVEAGLRSYDRTMPEEINRVLTDHISKYKFCPTETAVENLRKEGITKGVHLVGDVTADLLEQTTIDDLILHKLGAERRKYYVATVHRPVNTDSKLNMDAILSAFEELDYPVIFPVHPRTAGCICRHEFRNTLLIEPLGYYDMLSLVAHSRKVLTDSGGIQKEAYLLGVPCITLRETTEWIETLDGGWNILAGSDKKTIVQAALMQIDGKRDRFAFGTGRAAEKIVRILIGGKA